MILAAAVKFYIEKTNEEVILCGHRHGDIFRQLGSLGFEPQNGYKEIEQGFIDDKNNFLTRKEAYLHAIDSWQIEDDGNSCCELFSEDLW